MSLSSSLIAEEAASVNAEIPSHMVVGLHGAAPPFLPFSDPSPLASLRLMIGVTSAGEGSLTIGVSMIDRHAN